MHERRVADADVEAAALLVVVWPRRREYALEGQFVAGKGNALLGRHHEDLFLTIGAGRRDPDHHHTETEVRHRRAPGGARQPREACERRRERNLAELGAQEKVLEGGCHHPDAKADRQRREPRSPIGIGKYGHDNEQRYQRGKPKAL